MTKEEDIAFHKAKMEFYNSWRKAHPFREEKSLIPEDYSEFVVTFVVIPLAIILILFVLGT